MKKTILAEVDGWTPVIDAIAQEYGLVRAAVFGVVWRFCQMKDGVCKASLDTIARFIGLERSTVYLHIAALVKDKYLKDLTPNLRNRPHIYADTGKANMKLSIIARDSNPETVDDINTGVEQDNTDVDDINTGVEENHMSKTLKKPFKKQSKREGADKPRRTPKTDKSPDERLRHPAIVIYRDICHRTPNEIQRQAIIDGVGDDPEKLKLYAQVLSDWMLNSWNPGSVGKQLDALSKGGIRNGNQHSDGDRLSPALETARRMSERMNNGNA